MTDCNQSGCQVLGPHLHADLGEVNTVAFSAVVVPGKIHPVGPATRHFFGTSSFTCGPVEIPSDESERVDPRPDNDMSVAIGQERIRLGRLMAQDGPDALLNAVACELYWKGRMIWALRLAAAEEKICKSQERDEEIPLDNR